MKQEDNIGEYILFEGGENLNDFFTMLDSTPNITSITIRNAPKIKINEKDEYQFIDSNFFNRFLKFLEKNQTIIHLDLSGNNISADDVLELNKILLKRKGPLLDLNLSNNKINQARSGNRELDAKGFCHEPFIEFGKIIGVNSLFSALDLSNNNLRPDKPKVLNQIYTLITYINKSLNFNYSLRTLDVSSNDLPEEEKEIVAACIEQNAPNCKNLILDSSQKIKYTPPKPYTTLSRKPKEPKIVKVEPVPVNPPEPKPYIPTEEDIAKIMPFVKKVIWCAKGNEMLDGKPHTYSMEQLERNLARAILENVPLKEKGNYIKELERIAPQDYKFKPNEKEDQFFQACVGAVKENFEKLEYNSVAKQIGLFIWQCFMSIFTKRDLQNDYWQGVVKMKDSRIDNKTFTDRVTESRDNLIRGI